MALPRQTPVITRTGGLILIQMGPEGYQVEATELRNRMKAGGYKTLDFLLGQFIARLDAQGVDLDTATAAQVKTALEGTTYIW